jgi:hypothetical protein
MGGGGDLLLEHVQINSRFHEHDSRLDSKELLSASQMQQ